MKVLAILLLVGYVVAAPATEEDKTIVVNENFFPKEWEVYKSEHDIVSILVPLNNINFEEDTPDEKDSEIIIFFAEADVVDGKRADKGVYIFKNKVATKILDNGRDMAASGDESRLVFLAASDGLYVYKEETNSAVRYGSINDDIIRIAKEKEGDVIYILTANKEVYKVTDDGKVKEKLDDIVKADQIILDYDSNLFYASDSKVFVHNINGTKEVNVPAGTVTLIKPPYLMDNGIPCVVDNKAYILYPNGTSEVYGVEFKANYKPTAMLFSKRHVEAALVAVITDATADTSFAVVKALVFVFSKLQ